MTDEGGPPGHRPERDARAALWTWDLANDTVEWNDRLKALFGYTEMATNAAWRVNRIHPEDRDRVEASLQRATITNHGEVSSDQYRFRQADGSYAAVTERAYVVHDDAGPRSVLGAITPTAAGFHDPEGVASV
jgi:PAS domain S-box-containing protein